MGMEVYAGRVLKNTDLQNRSYVIVLSYDTAVEFFGRADVTGESLSLDGKPFQVVGVLSEESASPSSAMTVKSSDDSSETVVLEGYIPYATLGQLADNVLEVSQFYVSSADESSMEPAELKLEEILLERFADD